MLRAASRLAAQVGPLAVAVLISVSLAAGDAEAKRFKLRGWSSSKSHSAKHDAPSRSSHEDADEGSGLTEAATAGARAIGRAAGRSSRQQSERSSTADASRNAGQSAASTSKPASSAGGDYYTKRAEHILKREGGWANGPHPLAAAHPGMDVVVCEAGCSGDQAEIVYMQSTTYEPADADAASTGKDGPPAAATNSVAKGKGTEIVCIGGCYDTPRLYAAARTSPGFVDSASSDWISTVTPTSAAGSGSGAWMKRIDAVREKK